MPGKEGGVPGAANNRWNLKTATGHATPLRGSTDTGEGNASNATSSIVREKGAGETQTKKMKTNWKSRRYLKEATVKVHDIDIDVVGPMAVILAAEETCGINTVLAVVPDKDQKKSYEITMDKIDNAYKLTNGFKIGGKEYECSLANSDSVMVSFLYIPAYIEDEELLNKLRDKNIEILSSVYRKTYRGTTVADGTRCVRVRFPAGIVSLAWSMAFDTSVGKRYFKVIHDNQIKVCSGCYQPGHIYRECRDFRCLGCGEQGHGKRECLATRCYSCRQLPLLCKCTAESEDEGENSIPINDNQETEEGKDSHEGETSNNHEPEDKNEDERESSDEEEETEDDNSEKDDEVTIKICTSCDRVETECSCVCMYCKEWSDHCKCDEYVKIRDEQNMDVNENSQNEKQDTIDNNEKSVESAEPTEVSLNSGVKDDTTDSVKMDRAGGGKKRDVTSVCNNPTDSGDKRKKKKKKSRGNSKNSERSMSGSST